MNNRRKLSKQEREMIYNKFNGHCAYCGIKINLSDMQADHIKPLHLGGEDTIDNLFPACRSCNKYKHTYTIEKFRQALEKQPEVLYRDNATYRIAVRFGTVIPNKQPIKFYFERIDKYE